MSAALHPANEGFAFLSAIPGAAQAVAASKVHLADFPLDPTAPDGPKIRGLAATCDLDLCDVVLAMPQPSLVTAENVLKVMGDAFVETVLGIEKAVFENEEVWPRYSTHLNGPRSAVLHDEFVLCVFLILERFGPGAAGMAKPSPFTPFAATLPAPDEMTSPEFIDFEGVGLTAAQQRLLLTRAYGTAVRGEKAWRRRQKSAKLFNEWDSLYFAKNRDKFPSSLFTFGNWLWAVSMLSSRSFCMPPSGEFPAAWQGAVKAALPNEDDDEEEGEEEGEEEWEYDEEEGKEDADDDVEDEEDATNSQSQAGGGESPSRHRRLMRGRSGDADGDEENEDDDEDDGLFAMVPFADMINHSHEGINDFGYDVDKKQFLFIADRRYKAGEQVFLRYNSMGHWRVAKYYGFVPQEPLRTADNFPITVEAPVSSSSAESGNSSIAGVTRDQIFRDHAFKGCTFVTPRGPSSQLRGLARLRAMGDSEFARYTEAFQPEPLSIRNEWQAYRYIAKHVTAAVLELRENMRLEASGVLGATNVPPQLLSFVRGMAHTVRQRDLFVLTEALQRVTVTFQRLSSLMFYGSSGPQAAPLTPAHRQFKTLRAAMAQKKAGPKSRNTAAAASAKELDALRNELRLDDIPPFDVAGDANSTQDRSELTARCRDAMQQAAVLVSVRNL